MTARRTIERKVKQVAERVMGNYEEECCIIALQLPDSTVPNFVAAGALLMGLNPFSDFANKSGDD